VALHPAENRGYRELYLAGRHLVRHWEKLEQRLAETPATAALRGGAEDVREMLLELAPLTAQHGLHGKLAAQGSGAGIGLARAAVVDRFLERNQAVRLAHGELEHVITLLSYLAEVSRRGRNTRLAEFCDSWVERLAPRAAAVRAAAVGLGVDPDSAVEPLDPSPVGRAAHTTAHAVGTVGEWVDRQAARRRPGDYQGK
jgi:hypothetical protein